MNTRIRRKVHKKYILDVVCDGSTSDVLREMVRNTEPYKKIELNLFDQRIFTPFVYTPAGRHNLKYTVYRTEGTEENPLECLMVFEAVEFPDIKSASYNDLNYL